MNDRPTPMLSHPQTPYPRATHHRPPPLTAFEHTLLAQQALRLGVRLADLGKETGQMVVDGKFEVKGVKTANKR